MINAEENAGLNKLEGLNKRTVGNIVVYRIHLCNISIRILSDIRLVVRVFAPLEVLTISAFFILSGSFF